jgi:O-antigen/teichoic acid export membrane protein
MALFRFGGPLVPAILLDTALASLDRILLNRMTTPEIVGRYAFGMRLSAALRMFVAVPFVQIWGVRQLEVMEEARRGISDAPDELARIFLTFASAMTTIALGMALFAPEIVAIVASTDYADAALVVPLLALSQVFVGLQMSSEVAIHHSKRTEFQTLTSGLTLMAALPIYWYSIQWLGLVGASLAVALTQLIRTVLLAHLARRLVPEVGHPPWLRIAAVIGAGATVWIGVFWLFGTSISLAAVMVKLLTGAAFAVGLIQSGLVDPHTRRTIFKHPARVISGLMRRGDDKDTA